MTVGAGVSLFLPLAGTLSLRLKDERNTMNARVLSDVFCAVMLVEQLIFGFAAKNHAPYIIVTGILLLVYFLIAYGISKADM